jgi:hypothetical protein
MSVTGYLADSPHRTRCFNVVPGQHLTMRGVPHDVLAIASTGQTRRMRSEGGDYFFPSTRWVFELPLRPAAA